MSQLFGQDKLYRVKFFIKNLRNGLKYGSILYTVIYFSFLQLILTNPFFTYLFYTKLRSLWYIKIRSSWYIKYVVHGIVFCFQLCIFATSLKNTIGEKNFKKNYPLTEIGRYSAYRTPSPVFFL